MNRNVLQVSLLQTLTTLLSTVAQSMNAMVATESRVLEDVLRVLVTSSGESNVRRALDRVAKEPKS